MKYPIAVAVITLMMAGPTMAQSVRCQPTTPFGREVICSPIAPPPPQNNFPRFNTGVPTWAQQNFRRPCIRRCQPVTPYSREVICSCI
jgi:hypothetical protein